jgi:hypothetical protein
MIFEMAASTSHHQLCPDSSRLLAEEAKKQHNIEAITLKALPDVSPESKPENMEDDWIANFCDKCRLISDEQMQSLWARILAGEANSPGKFSKRTVNPWALGKSDATLFSQLCSFVFVIGFPTDLVFDLNPKIYNDAGIYFGGVDHLEGAGLLHVNVLFGYARRGLGQKGFVHYFDSPVWVEFPQEQKEGNQLNLGRVLLTRVAWNWHPSLEHNHEGFCGLCERAVEELGHHHRTEGRRGDGTKCD